MGENINTILARLERTAAKRSLKSRNSACTCPFGEKRFFFTVTGKTEKEVAEVIPENTRYCPKCGGLNVAIDLTLEELGL